MVRSKFWVFGFLLKNEHPAFFLPGFISQFGAYVTPYSHFCKGQFFLLTIKFKGFIPNNMTLRISGLIQSTKILHQEMAGLCSNPHFNKTVNFSNPGVIKLHEQISQSCKKVEDLCRKRKGTPADLPNPSYLAYQWLHFLSEKKWLLSHLHGLVEFQEILNHQSNKPLSRIDPTHDPFGTQEFQLPFSAQTKKTDHFFGDQ